MTGLDAASGGLPVARSLPALLLTGAVLAWMGPFTMDAYSPAFPALADDLGVSHPLVQLTLTSALVGLALGQLLGGVLALRMTRRTLVLGSLAAFTVASLLAALAPDLATLVAIRFVQGASAAIAVAMSRTIGRDALDGAPLARYYAHLTALTAVAPILGPLAASAALQLGGSWRWVFVVIGIAGAGALVVSWFTVPQAPGLPAARADDPSWVANLLELLRTKSAVLSILLMACTAGVVIGYLSGVSYLLQERFGMSATHYGVLFALNASTIFVAGQVNARLVRRFSPVSLLVGAFVLLVIAAGTLTVALATDAGLVLVESTLVLVLLGYGFAMANVLSTGMAVPRRLAATMASLLGVAQFGFGALTAPLAASATGAQIPSMALVLCGYTVAGLLLAVALRSARCPPQRKA